MTQRERMKDCKGRGTLTPVERYLARVEAGGGSRSFKEWLLSKPMDKFVVRWDPETIKRYYENVNPSIKEES